MTGNRRTPSDFPRLVEDPETPEEAAYWAEVRGALEARDSRWEALARQSGLSAEVFD